MAGPRFCEACGRQASADARFCAACGRPLAPGDAPAEGTTVTVARRADPAAPGDPLPAETDVLRLRQVAVQGVGEFVLCVLTLGIAYLVLLLVRMRERYRVTTQRIEVRTGLVNVTRRTVELFRVHDFEVREPWFLRIRGAGDLVVRSQDVGDPEIVLRALPDVRVVHDTIRTLVLSERRRHHVKVVEENR